MLYYLFWYNETQSRSFHIQLETTIQWPWKFEQKIIRDEKLAVFLLRRTNRLRRLLRLKNFSVQNRTKSYKNTVQNR